MSALGVPYRTVSYSTVRYGMYRRSWDIGRDFSAKSLPKSSPSTSIPVIGLIFFHFSDARWGGRRKFRLGVYSSSYGICSRKIPLALKSAYVIWRQQPAIIKHFCPAMLHCVCVCFFTFISSSFFSRELLRMEATTTVPMQEVLPWGEVFCAKQEKCRESCPAWPIVHCPAASRETCTVL